MNSNSRIDNASLKISVYVEDSLTKEYLSIIWADALSSLDIKVAGNANAVKSLVAYKNANNSVCWGIVDRDFRWDTQAIRNSIYTFDRHEIENYLLDAEAISNSTFNAKQRLTLRIISEQG